MTMTTTPNEKPRGNRHDSDYAAFLKRFAGGVLLRLASKPALFTTDADGLFESYLMGMPSPEEARHHTCKTCQQFIEHFGSLVTIDEDGRTQPLLWVPIEAAPLYREAFAAMAKRVRRAKVTGVFLPSSTTLGKPETGDWQHLFCHVPAEMVHKSLVQTAAQAMAEKREDFKNVVRALQEFSLPLLKQALTLLDTDTLYRSEKVRGPAQWLHDLAAAVTNAHEAARDNIVWRAVASAPAGFCHPRASMIGTLLDDLASGMFPAEVYRRFALKMHPLQYQRPQAAPSAGTVAQAEKVMQQLGAAGSLARRFARPDEVEAIWRPQQAAQPEQKEGSIFGHLVTKQDEVKPQALILPAQTMTWVKFERTILATAERIELFVRNVDNFVALTTAANPDAPPIIQWDTVEKRNPVAFYLYASGSMATQWNLPPNTFHPVTAATYVPSMWGRNPEEKSHHQRGVIFLLDGAKDSRRAGNALFPEILKADLHGIRSVIESYSRAAEMEGYGEESACGLIFTEGKSYSDYRVRLRVTANGNTLEYLLDRWD